MFKGSCLCKAINYTIKSFESGAIHCHCRTCRKAHASAFSSVALAKIENFHLPNVSSLSSFRSSSNKIRYFCKNCGSQIYAKYEHSIFVVIRLGTLDTSGLNEEAHIWLSHKVDWLDISTDIPCYEKSPK